MASGVFDDILIQHLWSTEEFRNIFNDHNRLQKWYDFEAAFALEQGELGIIPKEDAADIAANCKISKIDVNAVAAEIRPIKHPLVPAVKAVQKLCRESLALQIADFRAGFIPLVVPVTMLRHYVEQLEIDYLAAADLPRSPPERADAAQPRVRRALPRGRRRTADFSA